MFGIECLPLVLFGLQETDVVEHPHEALFASAKHLLILFGIVERLFRTLPHVKAARNGFTFGVELSVRINERKLLGAVQKLVIRVLTVDFGDGRIAEYDGSDLEMLDLAYASTIHKSQGSEYKSVIINLQCAHAVMLVRPLVYTAITRAKERVLIVGERRALCIAIKRTDTEQRGTMLSARIKELISNVKGDHYNGNLAQ